MIESSFAARNGCASDSLRSLLSFLPAKQAWGKKARNHCTIRGERGLMVK